MGLPLFEMIILASIPLKVLVMLVVLKQMAMKRKQAEALAASYVTRREYHVHTTG